MMAKDTFSDESSYGRTGLLKDQVQLVKRKDSDRYEIVSISDKLSYEKGLFAAIRACQLLVQKNDGLILVGIAGPFGAGKTAFTEKILNFMHGVAVISMDNYNDASRVIDGNFDGMPLSSCICWHFVFCLPLIITLWQICTMACLYYHLHLCTCIILCCLCVYYFVYIICFHIIDVSYVYAQAS